MRRPSSQANFRKKKNPPGKLNPQDFHIPGYGGFIPQVQARNMFGMTQLESTTKALDIFKTTQSGARAARHEGVRLRARPASA